MLRLHNLCFRAKIRKKNVYPCKLCIHNGQAFVCLVHQSFVSPALLAGTWRSLKGEGGTKVYINGPGHMTKMAAMPIYGKKHKKNLLLWNRWTNFNETCYVTSGALVHHSLYKS